ncbi:phage antirepressor [Bifidobacterium crudilactis]|jgi:anti-repressor protein|uniref:phage antirepressor n=1 Tax=Bifidobacterium crudilactis TaxID=327277 RepID=UPI002355B34E|nr:phage antirepressor KilAC domain-containing protein [Bifidobacterium crudilactis]MCI1868520.1 phage antirepressor KilAC domain-containing protein [Bifidobacterium crudilactis]
MNSLIKPFDFKGTAVRALSDKEGNPWLIAKDVCDVLGLNNVTEALRSLDDDEKTNISNSEVWNKPGRDPFIISEAGFYKLVMRSRKQEAKEFQRWVTHEVLPSIRRHGVFMTEQVIERTLSDPDYLIRLATQLKEQKALIAEQEQVLVSQAPKVLFADAVNASQTSILVGQLAKIIQQNGVPMGQRRLFAWLRERHYLSSRKGEDYNMPLQKYIEQGLFEIKESTHTNPDGVTFTTRTVKVTGKGQQYFVNKFLGDKGIGKAA